MTERRFSHNGQQALVRAYQAAREMGHEAIGPEHLLLGVLGEESALLKEWKDLDKQAADRQSSPRTRIMERRAPPEFPQCSTLASLVSTLE